MPVPSQSGNDSFSKGLTPKGSKGFTLVELLTVVAIIIALAAIAIPVYQNYVDKAKIAVAHSTLDTVRKTLEGFQIDYQQYPPDINQITGKDSLNRTVLPPYLVEQINNDVSWDGNYTHVPGTLTYSITIQARDRSATPMTLTPKEIIY